MRTKKSVTATPGANHDPEATAPRTRQQKNPRPAAAPDPAWKARKTGQTWQGRQTKQLPAEIDSELADLVAATGCELVHADWKGGALVLFIDRPSSGVSLADCEHVAKLASALLDVLDFGNGRYVLEVSSPGLDRQLYRPRDYERFLGRLVRVSYEMPPTVAERKTSRRTVVARLAEFRRPGAAVAPAAGPEDLGEAGPRGVPSAGEVTLIDDQTGARLTLKLEAIRLARLEVEL